MDETSSELDSGSSSTSSLQTTTSTPASRLSLEEGTGSPSPILKKTTTPESPTSIISHRYSASAVVLPRKRASTEVELRMPWKLTGEFGDGALGTDSDDYMSDDPDDGGERRGSSGGASGGGVDSPGPDDSFVMIGTAASALSLSTLSIAEEKESEGESAEAPPSHRYIRHFRVLAHIVRALLSLLPESYYKSDVIYEKSPEGEDVIRAARLSALVQSITPYDTVNPEHVVDIFHTYYYFTTPVELLEELIARFHWKPQATEDQEKATIVPLRVINVLRKWLKEHFYDFRNNAPLLERLEEFTVRDIARCGDPSVARWSEALKKIITEQMSKPVKLTVGSMKKSQSIPLNLDSEAFVSASSPGPADALQRDFGNMNPVEVFRQLTLMELEVFQAITPDELYYKTVKRVNEQAPILMKLVDHFNKISFWVASEICYASHLKQRITVLKRFIHIAQMCYDAKNFNSCLEVVGGLSMTPVMRLKRAWKNLPTKYLAMWRDLRSAMAPAQNYRAYRAYLATVEPPALPYFGAYLTDLTYIQEKYPTKLAGGLINFTKMRMISNVIRELKKYQQSCQFPYQENPIIQHFLRETEPISEDRLYEASKIAEISDESYGGTIFRKNKPNTKAATMRTQRTLSDADMRRSNSSPILTEKHTTPS